MSPAFPIVEQCWPELAVWSSQMVSWFSPVNRPQSILTSGAVMTSPCSDMLCLDILQLIPIQSLLCTFHWRMDAASLKDPMRKKHPVRVKCSWMQDTPKALMDGKHCWGKQNPNTQSFHDGTPPVAKRICAL